MSVSFGDRETPTAVVSASVAKTLDVLEIPWAVSPRGGIASLAESTSSEWQMVGTVP